MKNKIEIIANSALAVSGITLGILLYNAADTRISCVMFSIALACILYQFLGGIDKETSFQLGVIKFGGTAAILAGFMLLLTTQIMPSKKSYIDAEENWLPIAISDGRIVDVKFISGSDTIHKKKEEYINKRKDHRFKLKDRSDSEFSVEYESNSLGEMEDVGFIDTKSFKTKRLFNSIEIADKEEKIVQVFWLLPNSKDSCSTEGLKPEIDLPFEIKLLSPSRFAIITQSDTLFNERHKNLNLVSKTSYIVPYSTNESYVVFLEQTGPSSRRYFTKWLAKKISHPLG